MYLTLAVEGDYVITFYKSQSLHAYIEKLSDSLGFKSTLWQTG